MWEVGKISWLSLYTIDSARNLSVIKSGSLYILSSKKLEKALHRLQFSSSVLLRELCNDVLKLPLRSGDVEKMFRLGIMEKRDRCL